MTDSFNHRTLVKERNYLKNESVYEISTLFFTKRIPEFINSMT